MKDFNDVITAIKMCSSNYCSHPEYGDCPYLHDNGCLKHLKSDALYYLEEYKGLSKMWNDKLDKEQNNPPLSWEELKKLKGKPVWVEEKYSFSDGWYGQWEVIDEFWEEPYYCDEPYISMTNEENRRKDDLGKKWNAYRREIESEDE